VSGLHPSTGSRTGCNLKTGAMAWLMLHDCIPLVFELRSAYT